MSFSRHDIPNIKVQMYSQMPLCTFSYSFLLEKLLNYYYHSVYSKRGAQCISANGNREKNGRGNGNHFKTSSSRQRKWEHCQSKILLLFTVFLKYYISLQIQLGILLFSRQNMHYLTLVSELVACRLSLIANKQEFVKKRHFVVSISEIRK